MSVSDADEKCTSDAGGCDKSKDGVIFPAWRPFKASTGDKVLRGTVYLLALCYMFLGVAIVADKFMAAIEVITSKVKPNHLHLHFLVFDHAFKGQIAASFCSNISGI